MAKRHLSQDIVVIGLGRFGSALAQTLEENGYHVLGIDLDQEPVSLIARDITQAAVLDATNEEALRMVDITSFDTAVVAIGADFESNLMATFALKNLGVRQVICKALTKRQQEILLRVGADRVILPEYDAGIRLAEELMTPTMLEKLPLGPDHSVLELVTPHSLAWQSLAQINLRQQYGITVLVVKRENEILISPPAGCVLQKGDILVVLGSNENIARFSALE